MSTPFDYKQKSAVALRYDQEKEESPRVVAKGKGSIAEKIVELAREHDLPIHEDSDLVEVLAKLELNEEIPPHTYIAVAEILAFIYRVNQEYEP